MRWVEKYFHSFFGKGLSSLNLRQWTGPGINFVKELVEFHGTRNDRSGGLLTRILVAGQVSVFTVGFLHVQIKFKTLHLMSWLDVKGRGFCLLWRTVVTFHCGNLGKSRHFSARILCVSVEIGTRHLPNTDHKRYWLSQRGRFYWLTYQRLKSACAHQKYWWRYFEVKGFCD